MVDVIVMLLVQLLLVHVSVIAIKDLVAMECGVQVSKIAFRLTNPIYSDSSEKNNRSVRFYISVILKEHNHGNSKWAHLSKLVQAISRYDNSKSENITNI